MPFPCIVVVSGPSGSGKSTIVKRLVEINKAFFPVSCTTRKPRKEERQDVDYHFCSSAREFNQHEFLEKALVHGHWYGTPRSQVDDALRRGQMVIFDVDVQGALQIYERRQKETLLMFVDAPSKEERERRLRARGTNSEESIQLRLRNADQEIAVARQKFYWAINGDVEKCLLELQRAIQIFVLYGYK
jgi:guanylate kinase